MSETWHGCPECGYPNATPPKCLSCGAEITEEMLMAAPTPVKEKLKSQSKKQLKKKTKNSS